MHSVIARPLYLQARRPRPRYRSGILHRSDPTSVRRSSRRKVPGVLFAGVEARGRSHRSEATQGPIDLRLQARTVTDNNTTILLTLLASKPSEPSGSERERTPALPIGVRATIPRSMRPPWPRVARSRSVAPRHARPRSLSVSVSEAGSELGDSRRQPQKKRRALYCFNCFHGNNCFH